MQGAGEPLHVTLSFRTLQLLRSATLTKLRALPLAVPKAPAQIEKAQCMPGRVTLRVQGARQGAARRLARGSCSVTRALPRTPREPLPGGGGSNARSRSRSGHQCECRLLHPSRPTPRAGAWNLQAGQVPVRPQGNLGPRKGISQSDLRFLPLVRLPFFPA